MDKPDEALLWAREQSALPAVQTVTAHAYRAGAAASAERIKALQAALGHFLGSYCDTAFWDVENEPEVIAARALLKEPDQ